MATENGWYHDPEGMKASEKTLVLKRFADRSRFTSNSLIRDKVAIDSDSGSDQIEHTLVLVKGTKR